jgi:hypothetical protein
VQYEEDENGVRQPARRGFPEMGWRPIDQIQSEFIELRVHVCMCMCVYVFMHVSSAPAMRSRVSQLNCICMYVCVYICIYAYKPCPSNEIQIECALMQITFYAYTCIGTSTVCIYFEMNILETLVNAVRCSLLFPSLQSCL